MIGALAHLDRALLLAIHQGWRSPAGDALFTWITQSRHFLVPLLLLWLGFIVLGGRRGRVLAAALLVTLILTDAIGGAILKPLVHRVRPCFTVEGVQALLPQARSASFPSNHAANTFGAATVLFAAGRGWWALGFVVAAAVALSRVYVGVHYPSDVLGGAAIGVGVGLLVWRAAAALEQRYGGRRSLSAAPNRDRM
jgi:undecaprenyl-diphosphatase